MGRIRFESPGYATKIISPLGFHSSTDFKYANEFSNQKTENLVKSYTPDGLWDIMGTHAASWDATPLHDDYFVEKMGGEEENPSQFAKWVIELGLGPEASDLSGISPGKIKKVSKRI